MTLLADLRLQDLPTDALEAIRDGVVQELRWRARYTAELRNLVVIPQSPKTHDYHQSVAEVIRKNSSAFLALPRTIRRREMRKRLHYLSSVLGQDWSSLFLRSDESDPVYYVYAHIDPRLTPVRLQCLQVVLRGVPFYIGKGTGKRAWDLRRNQGHAKRISRLRHVGHSDEAMVQVIAEHLTERQAFELEAKLIYFFGSIYDEGTAGCLVNLADHVRPRFSRAMTELPSSAEWAHHRAKAMGRLQELPAQWEIIP